MCQRCEMSEYFSSLDPVAKARYKKKLEVLGLGQKDDPYATCNFVQELTRWPPIEYGHIFCYFVERPGVYTQQELMQWKSLDAYNYFQSGHVREVKLWAINTDRYILKALVSPSQRSPDQAHEAWIGVKGDGQIITAHCKCMAG